MKNPHEPNQRMLILLRFASMFLSGAIFGIAGFVYWANSAGFLAPIPLFHILFPIGIAAGSFIAYLPNLVAQILESLRLIKSNKRTRALDNRQI